MRYETAHAGPTARKRAEPLTVLLRRDIQRLTSKRELSESDRKRLDRLTDALVAETKKRKK